MVVCNYSYGGEIHEYFDSSDDIINVGMLKDRIKEDNPEHKRVKLLDVYIELAPEVDE